MRIRFTLLAFMLTLGAAPAMGATTTDSLSVTATVAATCTVTTSAVAFGAYDPSSGTDDDATGAVNVTCTSGSTYTIALDDGGDPSTPGDNTTRRMTDGSGNYLPYTLYVDAGRTTVWGDGVSESVSPVAGSHTGDGTEKAHVVYGRITAGQYVAPGSYSDTVTATVTYN